MDCYIDNSCANTGEYKVNWKQSIPRKCKRVIGCNHKPLNSFQSSTFFFLRHLSIEHEREMYIADRIIIKQRTISSISQPRWVIRMDTVQPQNVAACIPSSLTNDYRPLPISSLHLAWIICPTVGGMATSVGLLSIVMSGEGGGVILANGFGTGW